jgi:hypothetical protein
MLLQHAYKSQKAWSLYSISFEMAQAALVPMGWFLGNSDDSGVAPEETLETVLAVHEEPALKENIEGKAVGLVNREGGREVEKVV